MPTPQQKQPRSVAQPPPNLDDDLRSRRHARMLWLGGVTLAWLTLALLWWLDYELAIDALFLALLFAPPVVIGARAVMMPNRKSEMPAWLVILLVLGGSVGVLSFVGRVMYRVVISLSSRP